MHTTCFSERKFELRVSQRVSLNCVFLIRTHRTLPHRWGFFFTRFLKLGMWFLVLMGSVGFSFHEFHTVSDAYSMRQRGVSCFIERVAQVSSESQAWTGLGPSSNILAYTNTHSRPGWEYQRRHLGRALPLDGAMLSAFASFYWTPWGVRD